MADGRVIIDTQVDGSGAIKDLNGLQTKLAPALKKISGLIAGAFAVKSLIDFGKQAIETASDIQEVQNVVDTAFGDMSYKMEEFAKNSIKNFGISELASKQTGSTFMAMANGMGIAVDSASDMAIALTGLSADMASFYNVSQDVASTALKSIFTGETETLKQFGVVMTEANLQSFALSQGITKTVKSMTQAEKVQLRYNYVMSQTALAQGDFAKTSNSWANQTRILSEQWKQFAGIIGSGLLQVLTPVVQTLNQIMTSLIGIVTSASEFLGLDVKGQSASINSVANSTDKLTKSTNKATNATKKNQKAIKNASKTAKGSVSDFDKLNVITSETADNANAGTSGVGSGVSGGYTVPVDVDTTKLDEKSKVIDGIISQLKNKFKQLQDAFLGGFSLGVGGDFESRLKDLSDSISSIKKDFMDIFTSNEVVSSVNDFVNQVVTTFGQLVGSFVSIGTTIANNIFGGLASYLKENKENIKKSISEIFKINTETFKIFGDFYTTIADIFTVFESNDAKGITEDFIAIFSNGILGVTKLLSKFGRDLLKLVTKPITDNSEKIKTAINGTISVVKTFVDTIKDSVTKTLEKINSVYDEKIKPLIDSVTSGLSTIVSKLVDAYNDYIQPTLSEFAKNFKSTYENYVQPAIDGAIDLIGDIATMLQEFFDNVLQPVIEWIIDNILPAIQPVISTAGKLVNQFVKNVSKYISNCIDVIKGIVEFLTGVFSGDWEKAWNGIKKTFKSAFKIITDTIDGLNGTATIATDHIKDVFKSAVSKIKDVFSGIGNWFKTNVWDNIKQVFSHVSSWFENTFSTAWTKVKNVFSKGGEIFKGIKDGILSSLKQIINGLIDGINTVVSVPFNGLNNTIRLLKNTEIVGLKPFKDFKEFDVPKIPRLASGAVIPPNKEFMAILGDQKSGTNIETPLATMVDAFNKALDSRGNNGNADIVINIDGKEVFRVVQSQANNYYNRTGNPAFNV